MPKGKPRRTASFTRWNKEAQALGPMRCTRCGMEVAWHPEAADLTRTEDPTLWSGPCAWCGEATHWRQLQEGAGL